MNGSWWNILTKVVHWRGFLDSSVGKESACYVGNPCSIPGSGRIAGEYPLLYSWASLVVQLLTEEMNCKPFQYCLEIPMNSMKRQNDMTLNDELPK